MQSRNAFPPPRSRADAGNTTQALNWQIAIEAVGIASLLAMGRRLNPITPNPQPTPPAPAPQLYEAAWITGSQQLRSLSTDGNFGSSDGYLRPSTTPFKNCILTPIPTVATGRISQLTISSGGYGFTMPANVMKLHEHLLFNIRFTAGPDNDPPGYNCMQGNDSYGDFNSYPLALTNCTLEAVGSTINPLQSNVGVNKPYELTYWAWYKIIDPTQAMIINWVAPDPGPSGRGIQLPFNTDPSNASSYKGMVQLLPFGQYENE